MLGRRRNDGRSWTRPPPPRRSIERRHKSRAKTADARARVHKYDLTTRVPRLIINSLRRRAHRCDFFFPIGVDNHPVRYHPAARYYLEIKIRYYHAHVHSLPYASIACYARCIIFKKKKKKNKRRVYCCILVYVYIYIYLYGRACVRWSTTFRRSVFHENNYYRIIISRRSFARAGNVERFRVLVFSSGGAPPRRCRLRGVPSVNQLLPPSLPPTIRTG